MALQSDQFAASKVLKDIVFSNIKVEAGGKITFSVKATIDPSLISYAKNLTVTPAIPAQTTMSTSTPAAIATTSAVVPVPPRPASTTPSL